MKTKSRIITSALALGMAVQSLPAIVSYAEEEESYFSTYKGDDGATYLKVRLKEGNGFLDVPEEYKGEKIDKLNFRDISIPFDVDLGTNIKLVIALPESVELGDTEWIDMETGLWAIEVNRLDENGNLEFMGTYSAQVSPISSAPDMEVYEDKYVWQSGNLNVALNKAIYNDTEVPGMLLDELTLELPEDANIIRDNWLAEKTHILKIRVCYPSGKTELYKADDYDKYQKGNIKCNNYNIAIVDFIPNGGCAVLSADEMNADGEFWIWASPEKIDEIPEMKDADKMLITFLGTWRNDTYVDVLKIPDTVKELYLSYNAFKKVDIGKLILPDCPMKIDRSTFPEAKIKEIVFEGDAELGHMMFFGNETLENITFNGDVKMEYSSLWNCSSLKNVDINIDRPIIGRAFDSCTNLMTINGVSPLNNDGSVKPEYEEFIKKNFYDADDIGFLNQYVNYRIKQTVSETVTDDMPDIVKVKALHDKLCSMTAYDYDDIDAVKNHVDVSVFLNDTTVCEGYARALNLMLHEAGVESCFVCNDTHSWVIVKLGEHYFHVDPTWDDGDIIHYDWFMKSDSQIDGKMSHTDWELKCPSSMHSFQWETMPKCTDIPGDVDGNDIIDGRDATAILTSYAKASVGGREEVDSVLADFNFDGIVDGRDASAVLTEYARSSVDSE